MTILEIFMNDSLLLYYYSAYFYLLLYILYIYSNYNQMHENLYSNFLFFTGRSSFYSLLIV